jgi:hypothetical protein
MVGRKKGLDPPVGKWMRKRNFNRFSPFSKRPMAFGVGPLGGLLYPENSVSYGIGPVPLWCSGHED